MKKIILKESGINMLDFRIETFLTVCKYMNFTKASEALNITQPAVSHHIRFLENEYGVKLFYHIGKSIKLTPAGELLRNASLTIKNDDMNIKRRMRKVNNSGKTLFFGATLSVAEFMIVENLEKFILSHPDYKITMQVADTKELLSKLDSGELDFAIIEGNFKKSEYDYFVYSKEEYVACASPEKALKYKGASFNELFNECLILREKGSGTREILEQYLTSNGYTVSDFANITELGNIGTIKKILKNGYGITFLYRAAIKAEEKSGEMNVIELKDFEISHETAFVFRKNSIFKEECEKIFSELKGF